MRLRGIPPDIAPLSYVGSTAGTIIGSTVPLVSSILAYPIYIEGEGGGGGPTAWADITGKPVFIAAGATAAAARAVIDAATTGAASAALDRANHTGTQSADTLTDGTTKKAFLATERTKLTSVASGATANSSDATLLARANHTGSQAQSTVTNLVTDLAAKAPLDATLNPQSGTTYTFQASDDGKVVTGSNGSATTWTVPQNSVAPIPVGAYIECIQIGAGQITFVAGSGATLNSRGGALKINGQYGVAGLRKTATNTFILGGDLTS